MCHCLLTTKLRYKLKLSTKESKILIKKCLAIKKAKKYGVTRLIKEFKQEVEQAWCGGLSEAIAINEVH